jgi:SAM-dependent methyltransferase
MTTAVPVERLSHAGLCRICGDDSRATSQGRIVNGYALYRCESCGTILVGEKPDLKEVARTYDLFFGEGPYAGHRAEWKMIKAGKAPTNLYGMWLLRRVEIMVAGRRMIEIGGGSGAFGLLAARRGWEYVDFDISRTAIDLVRQLDLTAQEFGPDSLPPLAEQSADVVVMWEVIEHVWDVHGYLNVIKKALHPDGILLISTPNWLTKAHQENDYWGPLGSPPIHVNFFTRDSLGKVLSAAGFGRNRIIQRRMYRPDSSLSWSDSLKTALHIRAPHSLYAMVHGVEGMRGW